MTNVNLQDTVGRVVGHFSDEEKKIMVSVEDLPVSRVLLTSKACALFRLQESYQPY